MDTSTGNFRLGEILLVLVRVSVCVRVRTFGSATALGDFYYMHKCLGYKARVAHPIALRNRSGVHCTSCRMVSGTVVTIFLGDLQLTN